jgi:superfamily II DNA or RNA helicase
MAAEIVKLVRANGHGALFAVPRIGLVDQTMDAFVAEGIPLVDIGRLQGDRSFNTRAPVLVASIQTLQSRMRRGLMPPAGIIIVDECHERYAGITDMMRHPTYLRVPFVGLSATPWTTGLGRHWDDLVVAATIADLTPEYLVPARIYAPSHPDLSGVEDVAGDYNEGQLSAVMSGLVGDTVQTYKQKGEDRPTLAFCVKLADAMALRHEFAAADIAAEYADKDTPPEERAAIGKRLLSGATKVVCNVGVMTTGVDLPWVSCIILARPTKSESLYVQIVGRGLRPHPGKSDCLVFDHTDTALRLGLPGDIRYDSLDDGKRPSKGKGKDDEPKGAECRSCGAVKPAGVRKCPVCGHEPQRRAAVRPATWEFADGELAELRRGPEDLDGTPLAERMRWYAMLKWLCTSKGYNAGWLGHKYREKFGYAVGRDIDRGCRPLYPDDDVRNWIKSRAIAWRKAQEKAKAGGRAA